MDAHFIWEKVTASSGRMAGAVTDENIRTWWKADEDQDKNWIEVDLEKLYDVRAIQINFADDVIYVDDNVQIENTASLGNLSVSEKMKREYAFRKWALILEHWRKEWHIQGGIWKVLQMENIIL